MTGAKKSAVQTQVSDSISDCRHTVQPCGLTIQPVDTSRGWAANFFESIDSYGNALKVFEMSFLVGAEFL
jgi:hypothetical protein